MIIPVNTRIIYLVIFWLLVVNSKETKVSQLLQDEKESKSHDSIELTLDTKSYPISKVIKKTTFRLNNTDQNNKN